MAAARAEANRRFGGDCDAIILPDDAVIALPVIGKPSPDFAVLLGRGTCAASGGPTFLTGTGGGLVQVWSVRDGAPVKQIDAMMHGFSPTADGLLVFQHGSFCGGAPGASLCVTTYVRDSRRGTLEAKGQRLYDQEHPGPEPAMTFDWSGAPGA